MGTVLYSFAHDVNGRKALLSDGLFVEYAIFTTEELRHIPFAGARTVWQQPGTDIDLGIDANVPTGTTRTVDFHLNEAMTNLFVGLHRELRGEHLAASRFIQVHAVDHILALTRLLTPSRAPEQDPFDPTRRVESAHPALRAELPRMIRGYDQNASAAETILSWLTTHCEPNPAIATQLSALLSQAISVSKRGQVLGSGVSRFGHATMRQPRHGPHPPGGQGR